MMVLTTVQAMAVWMIILTAFFGFIHAYAVAADSTAMWLLSILFECFILVVTLPGCVRPSDPASPVLTIVLLAVLTAPKWAAYPIHVLRDRIGGRSR